MSRLCLPTASSLLLVALGGALTVGCGPVVDSAPAHSLLSSVDLISPGEPPSEVRWAGWRGAQFNGVAPDSNVPIEWSAIAGIRWKVPVPGSGHSSPVVWGERVFLTSLIETERGGQLAVLCFDRKTGELLWQDEVGPPQGASHRKNGHASATPAIDAQRVVVSFGSCGLFCYSHDGRRLWHTPMADLAHEWGAASSPVLYQRSVIQLCDSAGDSHLAAFELATGREIWRTQRDSYGSWSTPVLVDDVKVGDETRSELIVNGTGSASGASGFVIAYDPATGNELWRAGGTTDIPCPTLMVGDGIVVSTSGGNGPLLAIRPGGQGDVSQTHIPWRHPSGGPYVPTGVVYGARLYTVADAGIVRCYDLADGKVLWKKRLRGTFSASLIAAADRLYAVSEQGNVYVFAAADRYQPLAVNPMNEPCFATPAIAAGEILLRTDSSLVCVAEQTADDTVDVQPPAPPAAETAAQPTGSPSDVPLDEPKRTPAKGSS